MTIEQAKEIPVEEVPADLEVDIDSEGNPSTESGLYKAVRAPKKTPSLLHWVPDQDPVEITK